MPDVDLVGVVTNLHKGKVVVLLTSREVDPYKGKWSLPEFQIDQYERAEVAVKRGLKDMTGLNFTVRFFDYFDEIIRSDDIHSVVLVFECLATGKLLGEDELEGLNWVSLEKASSLPLAFEHNKILDAYKKHRKGGATRYMAKKTMRYLATLIGLKFPIPKFRWRL